MYNPCKARYTTLLGQWTLLYCVCINYLKYFVMSHTSPEGKMCAQRPSSTICSLFACQCYLNQTRVSWHDLGCSHSPHHLWTLISLLHARGCFLLTPQSNSCQACHIFLMYGNERQTSEAICFKETFILTRHKRAYVLEEAW